MSKGIFITATSTGIGKTVVSSLICNRLLLAGKKTAYFKPVQTGAITGPGNHLESSDCRFIKNVNNGNPNLQMLCSFLFSFPASPHFAAGIQNQKIKLLKIKNDYQFLMEKSNFIIVEGAGGIFVPLDEKGVMIYDIPLKLKIDTIIVSLAGLGAINHVGLTEKFLKNIKIKTRAIILLTENTLPNAIEKDNQKILKKLTNNQSIYLFPKIANVDTDQNVLGDINQKINFFPSLQEILKWFH